MIRRRVIHAKGEQVRNETLTGTDLSRTSLAALGVRKWRFGLAMAVLILAMVGAAYWTGVRQKGLISAGETPAALSLLLSPAPLSAGHRQLETQCAACHQTAFSGVSDQSCTHCHGQMAVHLPASANTLPKAPGCVGCHALHAGKAATLAGSMPACENCHREALDPARQASDFVAHHPEFRVAVPHGDQTVRIVPDAATREGSGLKFPHQIHLVKGGIKSPLGNTELDCQSCHRPASDGERFEPLDMAASCQQSQCHRLRLTAPAAGIIPHGTERDALQRLQDFFQQRLAGDVARVRQACPRPAAGSDTTTVQRVLDCAADQARQHAAATLFRTDGKNLECARCHEIDATGNPGQPWRVMPLRLRHDWQPAARFSHARHRTQACTACHDKSASKSSGDVAFPTRKTCLECHDGVAAGIGKLASPCVSCHRYHRLTQAP